MSLSLAYREYGSGPALIILHGLFGSARNWHNIAQQLAGKFHVYALDLRNHGSSPWSDVMDYITLADDVRRFIDEHDLQQAIVLGHSMGGKTAMVLALCYPQRIAKLIVADIAPVVYPVRLSNYIDIMQAIDLDHLTRRNEAAEALASSIPEQTIRAFLLQNLMTRNGKLAWRINLASIKTHMLDLAAFPETLNNLHYDRPSLFVYGEQSDYVKPLHHSSIQTLFSAAQLQVIRQAGHWLHAEQPQQLLKYITTFLA